jgi:hypothetical protein
MPLRIYKVQSKASERVASTILTPLVVCNGFDGNTYAASIAFYCNQLK